MHYAPQTVKRVSLELGGNAPFIVFDDADLELAAAGVVASALRNSGQTCICANRVFVQDKVRVLAHSLLTTRAGLNAVGIGDLSCILDACKKAAGSGKVTLQAHRLLMFRAAR
jgi:succinate-semialdehyde dehydrogenase/glutarate-semialdehyde dehydrogenase